MEEQPKKTGEIRDDKGRFVAGTSGNPAGKPKGAGISITTEIKRKLEEIPKGQKSTYLQLLIARIMKQAIQDGDQQMIKNIWNYIDGMPVQRNIHEGDEERPIPLDIKATISKIYGNDTPTKVSRDS
jgi:hypothetical protein